MNNEIKLEVNSFEPGPEFEVPIFRATDLTMEEWSIIMNPEETENGEEKRKAILAEKNIKPGIVPINLYHNRQLLEFSDKDGEKPKVVTLGSLYLKEIPKLQKKMLEEWIKGE